MTGIKKARKAGFFIAQEPRLLYVSFFVPLPSGRCPAGTANFLFLLVLSLHCPVKSAGVPVISYSFH